MAQMTTASIDDLPDSDFAYIEPGGSKDAQGRTVPRSKRHFPIHDAAHTRNAMSRAPQSPFGEKAMPKIMAAAKKFGIDMGDGDMMGGDSGRTATPYTRAFNCEVSTSGDGRTVEAYAAIFNNEAEVHDQDGDYKELIDPTAFNRAIDHIQRSGRTIPVLFNHGRTVWGTPDPEGSIPIGVAEEIRADGKGLFTRARFHDTRRAEDVLQAIHGKSITAYSFSGAFLRSDPGVPRGGFRPRAGKLPVIRRLESTLREFGPATFPVYQGAEIVGVRAEDAYSVITQMLPDQLQRLAGMIGTPHEGPASTTGDPSERTLDPATVRQTLRANHARFLSRRTL